MLQIRCPQCGASLKAPPEAVGRKVKCRSCQTSFMIDAAAASPGVENLAASPVPVPPEMTADVDPTAVQPVPAFAFQTAPDGWSPGIALTARGAAARRKMKGGRGGAFIAIIVVLASLAGGGYWYWRNSRPGSAAVPVVEMAAKTIPENTPFTAKMAVQGLGMRPSFEMEEGPDGAKVDPATGELSWTPAESQGPGTYTVVVVARAEPQAPIRSRLKLPLNVEELASPPEFEPVSAITTAYDAPIHLMIMAKDPDIPASRIVYSLPDLDPEIPATIDTQTGQFQFTPRSELAGQDFVIVVQAQEQDEQSLTSDLPVRISVRAVETPLERLMAKVGATGRKTDAGFVESLSFEGDRHVLILGEERLHAFLYPNVEAAQADARDFLSDNSRPREVATAFGQTTRFYRSDDAIVVYPGEDAALLAKLSDSLGAPFHAAQYMAPTVTPQRDAGRDLLISLYKERDPRVKAPRLISPFEYPKIRKVFADRFEKEHDQDLRLAFGAEYDDMLAWLNKRPDFKESLFLAFDPEHDNIVAGLSLVKSLREKFPKQIEVYGNLAIAIAVVWDQDRGIYHYDDHQRRVHAIMPDGLLGALENFQYLVETEAVMEGRIRFVPWEFLVHVVNHQTPVLERQWCLANMLPRRMMFGRCYSDVPYDDVMLATDDKVCKLDGRFYTLPNLLSFGGVCAMQADYAARVGKSLGVPAAYVGGASNDGELHAWVMWVELAAATPTNVSFTLQSHGRYRSDNYYVGNLTNPQTGRRMTDRDLERRLNAVGTNAVAKRQADLVMLAFPEIRDELRLGPDEQFELLSQVTRLAPWNEAAWMEVAKQSAERGADKRGRTQMLAVMDQLFKTFAAFPDYSLVVFPELIKFEPEPVSRIKLYYQLLDVYAAAKRPDLSFGALYQLADLLVENQRDLEAIQALAASAKKYADEGQYVPKMLDKLEALCTSPERTQALVAFYSEFLPLIPDRRGQTPSKYCMKTYERGIRIFQANGAIAAAQLYQQKLQVLKASGG